jgi:diaminopimelate decarboxylase
LLLLTNGAVELIRREETVEDYFATLNFAPQILLPNLSDKRNAA